jgi:coproporphyrinogen III oxidase-like Fe-S oxidoreductase
LGDQRLAIETEENPAAYQKQVASRGHGRSVLQSLSRLDQIRERVSMGLRMTEGLRMDDLNALGFQPSEREITDLQELGFLDRVTDRIRLTLTGRLAADRISLLLSP